MKGSQAPSGAPRYRVRRTRLRTTYAPGAAQEHAAKVRAGRKGQFEIAAMAWSWLSCPWIRVTSPLVTKNAW